MSTNRRHVFTGDLGDDGLGYDFELRLGRKPLVFEVKTFRGAGEQIDLGETEVDAARRQATNDGWRQLAITDVFDRRRSAVDGFEPLRQARTRSLGGSLRYAYRLP